MRRRCSGVGIEASFESMPAAAGRVFCTNLARAPVLLLAGIDLDPDLRRRLLAILRTIHVERYAVAEAAAHRRHWATGFRLNCRPEQSVWLGGRGRPRTVGSAGAGSQRRRRRCWRYEPARPDHGDALNVFQRLIKIFPAADSPGESPPLLPREERIKARQPDDSNAERTSSRCARLTRRGDEAGFTQRTQRTRRRRNAISTADCAGRAGTR